MRFSRLLEIRHFNVYRMGNAQKDQDFLKPPLKKEDLVYKKVNYENLKDIVKVREKNTFLRFQEYLNENEIGYYLYFKEQVTTCGWVFINTNKKTVRKKYILIPKGFAWLHDFWTHPDYRGKGLYPTLLQFICRNLVSDNLISSSRNVLIDTDYNNISSYKGILKAGFEPIGAITSVRIRRIWIVLRENYARRIEN